LREKKKKERDTTVSTAQGTIALMTEEGKKKKNPTNHGGGGWAHTMWGENGTKEKTVEEGATIVLKDGEVGKKGGEKIVEDEP